MSDENGKKFEKYKRTIPNLYRPGINPVITAILKAFAKGDDDVVCNLKLTKNQLFTRTGAGQFLDRLGANVGVSRPSALGLLDEDFQELIPNQSLKAKQIRQIFYDNADVFWGPLFSRVNVSTINAETWDLSADDVISVSIDGGPVQDIRVLSTDIAIPGSATAEELANVLSRVDGATVSIIDSVATGLTTVNLRTDTVGPRGSIQFSESTGLDPLKVDFPVGRRFRITDLEQRTAIYEINSRELIIELPATVPALRRTLRGSHHLHANATIEAPDSTSGEVFQGSFIYGPSTTPYTLTGQSAVLQQDIREGDVLTSITVSDSDIIPESGFLIFDFGNKQEEQAVGFISVPNANTILLDPSYRFQREHLTGAKIRLLQESLQSQTPRRNGNDLAFYLTSPAEARLIVQDFLRNLAAEGVILNFEVLLPEYDYLCANPYEG